MRQRTIPLSTAVLILAAITQILAATAVAGTTDYGLDPGNRFQPQGRQHRTIDGDLCASAVDLGRNQSFTIDLCLAWNDYDPGTICSPCSLPGPEIVARLDTQAGEQLRVTTMVTAGDADIRLYLATDCDDPVGSCVAASSGPGSDFEYTVSGAGEFFLYVDTTGECATVQVSRPAPASTNNRTFSALKAVYR